MNEMPFTGAFSGFYPGRVVDNDDPDRSGRVRVRVHSAYGDPEAGDGSIQDDQLPWAFPNFSVPGVGDGEFHVPKVGAQVWVGWYGGSPEYPIWCGGTVPTDELPNEFVNAYEGSEGPKTRYVKNAGEQVFEMRWKTAEKKIRLVMPNGVKIEMLQDAASGGPKVSLETPGGYRVGADEQTQTVEMTTPTQSVSLNEATPAVNVVTPGNVVVSGGGQATQSFAGAGANALSFTGPTTATFLAGLALAVTGTLTLTVSALAFAGALALTGLTTFAMTASGVVTITGSSVLLGTAAAKQKLCNEALITAVVNVNKGVFDGHVHVSAGAGSASSGPVLPGPLTPVTFTPGVVDTHTTVNVQAN